MVGSLMDALAIEMRLSDHPKQLTEESIFDGDTTRESRKARAAEIIKRRGLEVIICGRGVNGKPVDFAAAFERTYGEPLR